MFRPFVVLLTGCLVYVPAAFLAAPPGKIHFVDIARQGGIDAKIYNGDAGRLWIPETNGSGAAWLDFDNDGLMDLLIVSGGEMKLFRKAKNGEIPPPRKGGVYLYHNLGNSRFEDVTEKAGLSNPWWGTGANAADYNNDGYTDILITTIGRDLLYKNNGNGTFTEVGKTAHLTQQIHWHTGSAFGDYDNDGNVDLYIAGYVALDALPFIGTPPVCLYRGLPGFCGPMGLKGEPDILYRNNGDGTFTDVTEKAGVEDKKLYHGFTVVFHDFNGDHRPDIFVANDSDPNLLYINQGNGTFRESATASGVGFSGDGNTMANMGVAVGDFDNDGMIDLLTTDFSEDYKPLFRQSSPGFYDDISSRVGLATLTLPWASWAAGFTDFDNDGWRELWISNGHVYPNADALPTTSYLQPFVVLEYRNGKFKQVPDVIDNPRKLSHRGACTADFNNDGKMDIAVVPIEGTPLLLQNVTQAEGSWIGFHLTGTKSNRDALGAFIRIDYCGKFQVDDVRNGGSYLSRNDPRIQFGMGACKTVDAVTIRWPNGTMQTIKSPPANRYNAVSEP